MKKVLIVSYNFPPVGGGGVQRPVKFVKYLRDFGWEPVVLSVANPSVPVHDHGLLREVPEGVALYGARTLEPSYARKQQLAAQGGSVLSRIKGGAKGVAVQLLLPDLQVLWWPGLVAQLRRIVRAERPAVVLVSAPPFSSFLPVLFLGRLLGVPVVLDYRDEWAFSRANWENAVNTRWARFLDCIFERYAVTRCAAFTAVNSSYIAGIYARFPRLSPGKGHVITNGYDPDDFSGTGNLPRCEAPDTVTLVYTGTVWKATSFKGLVLGLKKALELEPGLRGRLTVKVFGRVVEGEAVWLDDPALSGLITLHGYVEHGALMEETAAADILLLTLSDLPGAEKIITAKAFEYMASGKQILALLPAGETRDLLKDNYNKVSLVHPEDLDGICSAVRELAADIEKLRKRPGCDVSRFSRRALTAKLAEVLEKVTGQ